MNTNFAPERNVRGVQRFRCMSPIQTQRLRIFLSILFLSLAVLVLHGCREKNIDYNLVPVFGGYFEEGMTRENVERKLAELGFFELIDEWKFENGDVELVYRTSSYKQWGANSYAFRFTADWNIIVVYPIYPVD